MSFAWLPGEPTLKDEYHPHYKEFPPGEPSCTLGKKKKKSRSCKSRKIRSRLLQLDPSCKYCGVELTLETSTLDHVIPRSKGGKTEGGNLVLACKTCNGNKADKIL
jgi:5-methylcytosine-specific restriction endonuclease McrA